MSVNIYDGTNLTPIAGKTVPAPTPDYVDAPYNSTTIYIKGMTCISGNKRYRYINSNATSGHQPPDATYWVEESVASEVKDRGKLLKSATSSTFASAFTEFYNILTGMTYKEFSETYIDYANGTILLRAGTIAGGSYQYIGQRKFQDTILVEIAVINSASSANFYRYTLATTGITFTDLTNTSYGGQSVELYR